MKELYYIVKSNLHYYPPCVSQIRILKDLGVKVTVLYGSSDEKILNDLSQEGIQSIHLEDPRDVLPGKLDKINNWLTFRHKLLNRMKQFDRENSVLWFGNAESLMPMAGALNQWSYVASFLELLDHSKMRLKLLAPLARKAEVVTTCEETRSYLMKYWFGLDKVPYTIPNKPYFVPYQRKEIPTNEVAKTILEETKNSKFVIYQGIFQNPEYMNTIAQVMHDHYPDMYLVMMGIDKYNIVGGVKAIHERTIAVDYIPAPQHLQVTANAYIGVLFYKPDSLNKVFCAPNKIFEYSYFGLPIIGNDIPGLVNTIGKAKAGICSDFSYDSILNAFETIEAHYDKMSQNAIAFYQSVDNVKTIQRIAEGIKVL